MTEVAENNLIHFVNISRKKEAIYANFRVKFIRNGVVCSSSIAVDITALELHPGDTLEKIIEACARHAVKEFKRAEIQWDKPVTLLSEHYLGVAQLG